MIEGVEWVWVVGSVFGGVVAGYILLNQRMKAVEVRMRHMSKRIEQLEAEVELEEPAINSELRRLIGRGEEVRAIKAARVAFGYSLIEAKHYVDGLKEDE